jgi:hypothetical protein
MRKGNATGARSLSSFGIGRDIDETPEDGPLAFLTLEPPLDVGPRERLEAHQTAAPAARTDRGIGPAERDGFRGSLHGHSPAAIGATQVPKGKCVKRERFMQNRRQPVTISGRERQM